MKTLLSFLVLAVPLSWLTVTHPQASLAIVLSAALAALFWKQPKAAAGLSVLAVVFGGTLETLTGLGALGYIDEAVTVFAAIAFPMLRWACGKKLRWLPGGGWFLLYAAFGGTSAAIAGVAPMLAAQSGFLMLKGVILAFGFVQLDWKPSDVRTLAKAGGWTIAVLLACSVANYIAPALWNSIFASERGGLQIRYGMESLIGPFSHPGLYGPIMALAAVALVAYRATVRKSFLTLVLLFGSFLGAIFSFRRKVLAASLIGMLLARTVTPSRKAVAATFLILAIPVVLVTFGEDFRAIGNTTYDEYLADPTQAGRTLFYIDSVRLATAAFPFGVGFARYGSYLAGQEYSPEYLKLGYNTMHGLGMGDKGGFLSDTFWPAIIGETGFIGATAYVIGLIMLARPALRMARRGATRYHRFAGVLALGWMAEFLVESVAAAVFNSPPMFALLFAALAISASLASQSPKVPAPSESATLAR